MTCIRSQKTTAGRDEKHLSFAIWCTLYHLFDLTVGLRTVAHIFMYTHVWHNTILCIRAYTNMHTEVSHPYHTFEITLSFVLFIQSTGIANCMFICASLSWIKNMIFSVAFRAQDYGNLFSTMSKISRCLASKS